MDNGREKGTKRRKHKNSRNADEGRIFKKLKNSVNVKWEKSRGIWRISMKV
jgi:hypothetical protein